MARNLTSVPDIEPVSSDYPSGRIQNEDPPVVGTPIIEELYGDLVQFFHKIMRLAGLAYNGLPDNETNSFQFITALGSWIRSLTGSTGTNGVWSSATNAETQAGILINKVVTPAGLESKTATTTRKGIQRNATDVEAKAGILIDVNISPYQLLLMYGGILRKTIYFTWNMDTDIGRNISHGFGLNKIIGVSVSIKNNSGTILLPLNYDLGGAGCAGNFSVTATEVQMLRINGGVFDAADYTSANGYLIIDYIN